MPSEIKLIHGDCMDLMHNTPDKFYDLAIVDPPYGIFEDGNRDIVPKGAASKRKKYHSALWSQEKPPKQYFQDLLRISKTIFVWGGNYFANSLPESRCWLVWDKRGTCPGNDFADCELAWTSLTTSVRKFTYLWNGMLQENMKHKENRIHPTQKPVALYSWILKTYGKPGYKVLDTHLGSGSIAIACYDMGFDLVGCEIDESYFKAAVDRLDRHKKQGQLFL